MNARLAAIRRRRQLLLTRIAVQRLALTRQIEAWHAPLAVADSAFNAGRTLRRHPWIVAFAAALLLRAPQHRLALWATRALTAWRLYRVVRAEWSRSP